MNRAWLTTVFCLTTLAAGQSAGRSDIPFNAAVYGAFVMPFPEFGRYYETSSVTQAARFVGISENVRPSLKLSLLGVWITRDATHDPFRIFGEDRKVPGATFVFSRDEPGPSMPSKNASAIIIQVERPNLSQSQYAKTKEGLNKLAKNGAYNVTAYRSNAVYSYCVKNGGQDYPVFNEQFKLKCSAELKTAKVTLRVSTINLSEKLAIRELIRISSMIR